MSDMEREMGLPAPLPEQAADWWVVLHDERSTRADERAFAAWVRRSPERVEAFLQMARLMGALKSNRTCWPDVPQDVLVREARAAPPEVTPIDRVRNAPCVQHAVRPAAGGLTASSSTPLRKKWLVGLVASAAVVAAVAVTWISSSATKRYATALGEQRSAFLDDGSVVTLNTSSAIEVEFRKDHRSIRLIKGEALFQVAHDVTRPFDVTDGATTIRAVGTSFNVQRRLGSTTVTVVEGEVAVIPQTALAELSRPRQEAEIARMLASRKGSPDSTGQPAPGSQSPGSARAGGGPQAATAVAQGEGGSASPIFLVADEQMTITGSGRGTPEHVGSVEPVIAWTHQQLVFERRPLGEVADEFNRYNRLHIEIHDDELARHEVTGVFRANNPESFLAFLGGIPGVRVEKTDHDVAVVMSRP